MPALNDAERDRLRRKLGHSATSMSDVAADDLFDEAESLYAGYGRAVVFAAAVLEGRRELYAEAVKEVSYRMGDSQESLSDRAKALLEAIKQDEKKLADLVKQDVESPAVMRIGRTRPKPRTYRDMPG